MIAKTLHIIFAFLILISSTGFTLKKHYCQHKLENVSFLPTSSCCKSKAHSSCKSANDGCKTGCCSNEIEYFSLDQDLKIQEIEIFSFQELLQFYPSIKDTWDKSEGTESANNYLTYKPPIVQRDISVLFQNFRL